MEQCHVMHVAELEKLCFSDPWNEAAVGSELSNPLSCWVVAMDGDRLAGYVGSQSVMGWADMMNLAVHPDFRMRGIATELVERLIAALRENGVYCLTLEVRVSNFQAIELYKKLGFVQIGKRPNYYSHPKEDALILRLDF